MLRLKSHLFPVLTLLGVAYLASLLREVDGLYFEELEKLKPNQKAALQKLKTAVSPIVPHAYMREDIELFKWLQVTNWNPRKAAELLKESIKWRKENRVDEWLNPGYFSEFEKDYPTYCDGFDKAGRPIMELFFGDYDVRKVALAGKIKHFTHYILSNVEKGNKIARELQAQGKNVTGFVVLAQMEGFTIINQGCPACIPLYLGYMTGLEKNWPWTMERVTLVNTPDSFQIIFNLMRPIMSAQTRRGFLTFNSNKPVWMEHVKANFDLEQIGDWYGGYKKRSTPAASV